MSFSEKLQKLRKANKLSQEALADLLDVTRQSVSKWESGQTYPEMDKLLAMCKIFKCSLDDLTNDEITDVSIEEKKKSNFNTIIDSILWFINQTYQMISKMTFSEIIKCFFTMFLVGIGLLILRIPIELFINSINSIFYQFDNHLTDFIASILNLLIDCGYFLCVVLLFMYIFKIVYLDNEKYLNRIDKKSEEKVKVEVEKTEATDYVVKKQERKKHVSRGDAIFKFLGSALLFFIKSLSLFFSLPLLVFLFLLCAGLLIVLYLLSRGVLFISVLVGIPFGILFLLVILNLIYSFILGKTVNGKKTLITFFISIIGLGSSFGIFLLDMASINFINEVPNNIKMETEIKTYDMTEDLVFLFEIDEYIEDESLVNQVRVEVDYYSDFIYIMLPPELYSSMIGYGKSDNVVLKELMNQAIDDLSNKTVYNYDKLRDIKVRVYGSKESIKKLEDNYVKEIEEMRDQSYREETEYYEAEIANYEIQINDLNSRISELENQIELLEQSNEEYKQKIEDYKETLQSIITE